MADRKEEMSKSALLELQKITSEVTFLILDLSYEENCKKLIDTAWDAYGRIDVLVNNAGITGFPAPVHTMSKEMFMEVMACNVYSAFFCSHYALAHMIEQGGTSCVVNVSSVAGLTGFPSHSAYVTSKHALSGLTKNMAMDYAKYGIRVNAVNPGTTDTQCIVKHLHFLQAKRQPRQRQLRILINPYAPKKLYRRRPEWQMPQKYRMLFCFLQAMRLVI